MKKPKVFKIYEAFQEFDPNFTSKLGQLRNLLRVDYYYSSTDSGVEIFCPGVSLFDLYLNAVHAGFKGIIMVPLSKLGGAIEGSIRLSQDDVDSPLGLIEVPVDNSGDEVYYLSITEKTLRECGVV